MGRSFFEILSEVVFWVLLVVFVYQLLLKLTGHSPTDIQILYGGVGLIVTYLIGFSFKMGRFIGGVEEFMYTSKNTFRKIGDDMKEIKEHLLK